MSTRRTRFRPCIDLHEGRVKQIVGGTLGADRGALETNFETTRPAAWFAGRYGADGLTGGHVIKLGPGNETAAREALAAYPGGLHIGGGITSANAAAYLDAGASHVIVTSALFEEDRFSAGRLQELVTAVGASRLVLDLSCRRTADGWVAAKDRWQTLTDLPLTLDTLGRLSASCAEFLIHAADVEGKCEGIDEALVSLLGQWDGCPVTYAGGARSLGDLARVNTLSAGRVDLTIGSALDLFGGHGVRYEECLAWNRGDVASA